MKAIPFPELSPRQKVWWFTKYRHMFAVLTDGTVLGPRGKKVDEAVLVAWFDDEKGLNDVC